MGSLIAGAAGTCMGYICCGACRGCSEAKYGAASRLPYIFQFFVAGVFALVMSLYGEKKINLGFTDFEICNKDTCAGNGSVYRVSFVLFLYELIHVIIIYAGAIEFHWLWFPFKFLVFVGGVTATFFVKHANHVFDGYSEFARFASALYLVMQLLILVTFAWDVNDYLQRKSKDKLADNEEYEVNEDVITWCQTINWWFWIMFLGTLFMYVGTYVLLGFFYAWYGGQECKVHNGLITSTIILVTLNIFISIARGNGSILVSALVSFYGMFLLFGGIQADPDRTCNIFAMNRNTISMWIGFMMAFISLFYAALRSSRMDTLSYRDRKEDSESETDNKNKELLADADGTELNMGPLDPKTKKEINGDNNNSNKLSVDGDDSNYKEYDERYKSKKRSKKDDKLDEDDADYDKPPKRSVQRRQNSYFHFVLMLGSAYMCMLFTNWGTNSKSVSNVGKISLWINMASMWLVFALFWQTLVMPLLCPSRFPDETESDDEH